MRRAGTRILEYRLPSVYCLMGAMPSHMFTIKVAYLAARHTLVTFDRPGKLSCPFGSALETELSHIIMIDQQLRAGNEVVAVQANPSIQTL